MKLNKAIAAAASGCLLLTGCGSNESSTASSSSAPAAEPSGLSMVTLGDSISYGYGLSDPTTERYSALLTGMLEQKDSRKWNDYNYALSGDDSSDLIERLQTGKALRLPSADVIVVEIGANNLLGVLTSYMSETAEANGIDLNTIDSMTDEELDSLQSDMMEQLQDTDAVMAEFGKRIDENLERLTADLETIYSLLREKNSSAEIYFMNVYNPFRGMSDYVIGTEEEIGQAFGDYAQDQIDRCNKIIADFTAAHSDLHFVDIAAPFAATDPVPIIGAVSEQITGSEEVQYVDPHPNADGQKLIADTMLKAMRGDA
ncbi:MAG: hypothetical protein IJ060_10250 [Oscillospiraceae bacterium]|nr:hypothetical protein [Oscillospiraceae bacterium]